MRIEYRVETIHDGDKNEMDILNNMGAGGWELCSVLQVHYLRRGDTYTYYYFKRRVETVDTPALL